MATLADLIDAHGVEVLDHLDRQVDVPVLSGPQCQGDVSVLPVTTTAATTPVPAAGVAVVRGESGGNTHRLLAGEGVGVFFDAADGDDLTLGTLTVEPGATAYLAHPEHAYSGIAPGTYRIGRQREFAGEWRLVAD